MPWNLILHIIAAVIGIIRDRTDDPKIASKLDDALTRPEVLACVAAHFCPPQTAPADFTPDKIGDGRLLDLIERLLEIAPQIVDFIFEIIDRIGDMEATATATIQAITHD